MMLSHNDFVAFNDIEEGKSCSFFSKFKLVKLGLLGAKVRNKSDKKIAKIKYSYLFEKIFSKKVCSLIYY